MAQRIADPYAVLGVPRGASRRQVKAAYRRLAKRYHPDVHRDPGAGEQMRRINQAWEMLSSPARSRAHDADPWAAAPSPRPGHWAGYARHARPAPAPEPVWRPAGGGGWGVQPEPDRPAVAWPLLVLAVPLAVLAFAALAITGLPPLLLGLLVLLVARAAFRGAA